MANAKAQHELVGVLVNKYPRLAVRLAEVAGEACPVYDRVTAGPNTHQVRKDGKRGQVESDATVHLLRDDEKCHFLQVEMQRDYTWSKLATLRAYHGSEVRNAGCGGHMLVLSPKTAVTDRFARAEKESAARLAFSVSYLAARDLAPLAADDRPFEERALAATMTDFSRGVPDQVIPMLLEMRERDETVADLFLTAILEECPDADELGEKMSDLAMQRLQALPAFQRWAARTSERIEAEIQARFEAEAARARAQAEEEAAEARAQAVREAAEGRAQEIVRDLQSYFAVKGEVPSLSAMERMNACTEVTTARYWLNRAYAGETSAQIFADGSSAR